MDPFATPVPTQQEVDKAAEDRLHGFGLATAVVSVVTGANYFLNAPGGKLLQFPIKSGVTGIDVEPTPTGRASVKIPKASFLTALLPAPVGYVPAEFYGMKPNAFFSSPNSFPGSGLMGFDASPARLKEFTARQYADDIGRRALWKPPGTATFVGQSFAIPAGPIPVSGAELAFLQKLPAGVSEAQFLIPALEARRKDLVGGNVVQNPAPVLTEFSAGVQPIPLASIPPSVVAAALADDLSATPANGASNPEMVKPTNRKAIENAAAAIGIRRDLATERLDP